MEFKLIETTSEVDAMDPESSKLSQPETFEKRDNYKIEIRIYNKDNDDIIREIESYIASRGATVDSKKDSEGEYFSSFLLDDIFNTTDEIAEYLTYDLDIFNISKIFDDLNSYMKIYVYEIDSPNEKINIDDIMNIGSPTIKGKSDANQLIQSINK